MEVIKDVLWMLLSPFHGLIRAWMNSGDDSSAEMAEGVIDVARISKQEELAFLRRFNDTINGVEAAVKALTVIIPSDGSFEIEKVFHNSVLPEKRESRLRPTGQFVMKRLRDGNVRGRAFFNVAYPILTQQKLAGLIYLESNNGGNPIHLEVVENNPEAVAKAMAKWINQF